MRVLHGLDALVRRGSGAVLSIGNFDGIHRGHRRLLERARQLKDAHPGGELVVVTFEPHPLTVLRPQKVPPRLTPPALKQRLLAAEAVDELIVLPPAAQVLNLTAEAFWRLLRDHTRPAHLVEGPQFTFGKDRAGTVKTLRRWCAGSGVTLHVVEPVTVPLLDLSVVPVSSSLVRWLLSNGRARDAAICLGRPYLLEGEVVAGHGRGRQIGVPTANLRVVDQLVPMPGVYAGRCTVDGVAWPAAVSIGTMPTFGSNPPQIEAHLIGYSGDLYGRRLEVQVIDWLREQWKFVSIDALKRRIDRDIALCRARESDDPSRLVVTLAGQGRPNAGRRDTGAA